MSEPWKPNPIDEWIFTQKLDFEEEKRQAALRGEPLFELALFEKWVMRRLAQIEVRLNRIDPPPPLPSAVVDSKG